MFVDVSSCFERAGFSPLLRAGRTIMLKEHELTPRRKESRKVVRGDDADQTTKERARRIQKMFGDIADRYDFLNHALSLNVDRRWRAKAAKCLLEGRRDAADARYLDACAGTFDLALALSRRADFRGSVVALDFALPMVRKGVLKSKGARVDALCGDALGLPFADETFVGAAVGFGIRNVADLDRGLSELRRVLAPKGRLVILEFSTPANRLARRAYHLYFHRVLPLLGGLVSGHPKAYRYLPKSVRDFPGPGGLAAKMRGAGFRQVQWRALTLGIAAIHIGVREGPSKP